MSFKIEGLDELKNSLKTLENNVNSLDGQEIPFEDLFSTAFMKKHTNASCFNEFLEQGNFKVESQSDFEAIPDDIFDAYVASATDFDTWEDMLNEAATECVFDSLDF